MCSSRRNGFESKRVRRKNEVLREEMKITKMTQFNLTSVYGVQNTMLVILVMPR